MLFYLNVNADIYNTDTKKFTFALSFMTKGAALFWAAIFHNSAISGSVIMTSLETHLHDYLPNE